MDQEFFNLTAYRHFQRYPTSQMEELRQMYAVWSAWAGELLLSFALHPGLSTELEVLGCTLPFSGATAHYWHGLPVNAALSSTPNPL